MYKRPDLYPDGRIIPIVLPNSYRLAGTEGAPAGQSCSNCKAYNETERQCTKWYNSYVWPAYWCQSWTAK